MEHESKSNDNVSTSDPSSNAAPANNPTSSNGTHLQKRSHKKRKSSDARLRKLWRRSTSSPQGITSRAEWEELMELHSDWKTQQHRTTTSMLNGDAKNEQQGKDKYPDVLPGPSVTIRGENRDFRKVEQWQSTKVADHRDILVHLLFGGDGSSSDGAPSKKKRKKHKTNNDTINGSKSSCQKEVDVPSLPSWANIVNLASLGGVAVIEIEINDTNEDTKCSLMPSELFQKPNSIWETMLYNPDKSDSDDNKQHVQRFIRSACKVKLFQGDYPRRISDELMYLPPPSSSKLTNNFQEKDLFQSIYDLRLSSRQLQTENFPRRICVTEQKIEKSSELLFSKRQLAREKICTRAKSFWNQYASSEKSVFQINAAKHENDALEIVETLSVREQVCCIGEDETGNNDEDEFSKSEYYVDTFEHDKERPPKVFALDCEMVQTSVGAELARVSVVLLVPDKSGLYSIDESEDKIDVIMDELVKPRRPILDYLTEYSGVTAKMLEEVSTRIEHVQAHLLSLIQKTDVIVGHSLENDLKALRILHTNVVDTSVIFRGGNGRKYGLRHLTNVLLKKQIQSNVDGHCSTEDAEAALILATKRAKLGPAFQLKENSRGKNIMRSFQNISRDTSESSQMFARRNTGPCVCIGSNEWISKYAKSDGSQHALSCESIMNSMSMAIPSWLSNTASGRRAGFLWANLSCGIAERSNNRNIENDVKKLEEIVSDLHRRVPSHTPILMVFQRNYKQAVALTKERKTALKSTALQWTSEQEQRWQNCMEACMNGEAIYL